MPEDLEPEPQRYTGYLIRRAQQLHVAAWMRTVSTEISTVQYSALVVLDQRGTMSQRELCDAIDLDRSTIADMVARMERRGLVVRTTDPDDGRRKAVELSEHGRAERRRLRPLVEQVEGILTDALSVHTRNALRDGLRRMLADS
ncbi:MarR family winged helix-turn-helix transcriptional regulator [Nocardioides sp. Iso805N]|uniref:MarR family winged helix-turn-helix transcriptional regulator n=1 Tax=Nocardioides sp. Iso805N TaxID=1283287 RepID=UPI00037ED50A|nr:MarR family transcriptional regulator [Nocardioides sp. Iso805N]